METHCVVACVFKNHTVSTVLMDSTSKEVCDVGHGQYLCMVFNWILDSKVFIHSSALRREGRIGAFDRWPARFAELPLNVCQ